MTASMVELPGIDEDMSPNEIEDLAIVIPVRNMPEGLSTILKQVRDFDIFSEVIICDDASDVDCNPKNLGFTDNNIGARIIYLRSETQLGAGHARNQGLLAVSAKNVLFFDADDYLHENIIRIWKRHIEDVVPDFTIFRHDDTSHHLKHEGSFADDESLWDHVLQKSDSKVLSLSERARLGSMTAYPWNKIYKTDFLIQNHISCSETPVHNDIKLHWLSFTRSKTVLAVKLIGAVHVTSSSSHHLTNKSGEERLCLGGILQEITDEIRNSEYKILFIKYYIEFVYKLMTWNLSVINDDVRDRFVKMAINTFLYFEPDEFLVFSSFKPQSANETVSFIVTQQWEKNA